MGGTGTRAQPVPIALRAAERRLLQARVRCQAAPWREVIRTRIVLDAAGLSNTLIARRVGVAPNTVSK